MPDIDLGALTIPVFATIFGAGWAACYTILVVPMKARVEKMDARLTEIEKAKDQRIEALERKLGIT